MEFVERELVGSWFESWKAAVGEAGSWFVLSKKHTVCSAPISADALPCAEISAGAEESARLTHRDFWQN
jgi:hypothetical protein